MCSSTGSPLISISICRIEEKKKTLLWDTLTRWPCSPQLVSISINEVCLQHRAPYACVQYGSWIKTDLPKELVLSHRENRKQRVPRFAVFVPQLLSVNKTIKGFSFSNLLIIREVVKWNTIYCMMTFDESSRYGLTFPGRFLHSNRRCFKPTRFSVQNRWDCIICEPQAISLNVWLQYLSITDKNILLDAILEWDES